MAMMPFLGTSLLVLCLSPRASAGRVGTKEGHLRHADPPEKATKDRGEKYTLIQYIQSSTCMGERFVCQPLQLEQVTSIVHKERKICSKVSKVESGDFEVDTCPAKSDMCEHECECSESFEYKLDECMYGENFAKNVAVSWKLVKGTKAGCISNNMDTGLARACNKWPSKKKKMTADEGSDDEEAEEEEESLLAQKQNVTIGVSAPEKAEASSKMLSKPVYDSDVDHATTIPGSGHKLEVKDSERSGGVTGQRYANSVVALFALLAVAYTR